MELGVTSWQLWAESCSVIALRSMRMMQGGKLAEHEAERMVSEKIDANMGLAMKLATAGPTTPEKMMRRTITHYRRPVRANQRRLMR
ncbi:hypothetical protein D6851_15370 [Altericroceibacterium spongiae]|uniref:Antibiotic ABC transporter n=2 Tax=Altericroceibacterium spongiae TaxID=2320269 RepID=A0A420EC15_9SPHN|nr:hypothetical protein D6851_15370 [Altericroceibacterium spongiae]